ncbi:UvrD-helicase domain-containing protein [Streptomyces sp. ITFR-6]|uniref:UvrD-helicase domain-containing protein n=1 Tax=Streptomyces sp. ITFR-6 TaxID=3075197 RepID=UPI00288A68D9|nr:UvrD-helicase domain-containing protein [Streptomyces sp. ITFR-6]WNI33397.1 UvrD-helicase domain-containing protein [Streptomyces sp. ITFR-6]
MTPLYAPDVFIKDKVEALAQQLGLELPHQEQWDFIQSAESLDLQAAPGSGKTSLIGLKLALLSQGWTSPTRGICVLSHTNTAKDEITNRLTASPPHRRDAACCSTRTSSARSRPSRTPSWPCQPCGPGVLKSRP